MYYLRLCIELELQQQESRNEIQNECILIMFVALEVIFFLQINTLNFFIAICKTTNRVEDFST